MSKVKKWVAFIVMVCLLTTIMPVNAFADSTTGSPICGMEEGTNHTHTEACYQEGTSLNVSQSFEVSEKETYEKAINDITASQDKEFEIVLTKDFKQADGIEPFMGIENKHVTLKSMNDECYSIYTGPTCSLEGDVTFDNVKPSSGTFYANGHLLETTRKCQLSASKIYGGSDKQDVASTHLILNGGKVSGSSAGQGVYGGGSGHDVTGDVDITLGGTFSSGSISYGGGYDGNVGGNIHMTIQGDVNGSSLIGSVFGGGFANSDKGLVSGNITINFVSGRVQALHGGCVSKNYKTLHDGVSGDISITIGYDGAQPKTAQITGTGVYGGGSYSKCNNVKVTLEDGSYTGNPVFGGSDAGAVDGSIDIVMNGGDIYEIHGGNQVSDPGLIGWGQEGATVGSEETTTGKTAIHIQINGGNVRDAVWGCGEYQRNYTDEYSGLEKVYGNTLIEMNGGRVYQIRLTEELVNISGNSTLIVRGGSTSAVPSVYGAYDNKEVNAYVGGKTSVIFDGCGTHSESIQDDTYLEWCQIKNVDTVELRNHARVSGLYLVLGSENIYPFFNNVNNLSIKDSSILALDGTATINEDFNIEQGSSLALSRVNTPATLNVNGKASGQGNLYTIEPDNWDDSDLTNNKILVSEPKVGEVYLRSTTTDETAAPDSDATLLDLANNNSSQTLYVEYTQKQDATTENYMHAWRIAEKKDIKSDPISIQPADVTIYMGGEGYEGTVDKAGNLVTDSDQIKKNGFPEPGFLITLPESLKSLDPEKLYLQYKDAEKTYQWKFEKYGEGDHNVYRIVPYGDTEKRSVRMQFTRTLDNEQTEIVTSDNFDVAKYINETLTMKVYGEGVEEHKVNFVYDEDGDGSVETDEPTYDIAIQDGTLTVRGTTSAVQTALVNKEESFTATKDQPGITAPEGTTYTINGSDVRVDDTTGISLLFDNIIDSNAGNENAIYTDLLKAKVDETFGSTDESRQYEYKYLDLVDTHNGNAWVAANKAVTVYWPLPEGADADADFTLLHFQDLHRSMSPTQITNKLTDTSYKPEVIQGKVEGNHIVFDVQPYNNGSGGFSPYVLVWEDESGNGGDSGEDTPSTPVTPPDGDDTPDLNTIDHFSYVVGYEDGMVKPEKAITRAEVATIFYRLLKDDVRAEHWTKSNDFTDVAANDWYNTTVSTLNAMGIITGYEDGSFKPNAPITRVEFAAMAVRFFEEDSAIYEEGTFNDIAGSEWFADAVQAAKDHSIIGGYPDGSFQPNKNISRAEACSIINRTLGRIPHVDHLLPADDMKTWPDNNPSDWFYADMQEATNGHEYEWTTEQGQKVEEWTEILDKDWEDR